MIEETLESRRREEREEEEKKEVRFVGKVGRRMECRCLISETSWVRILFQID